MQPLTSYYSRMPDLSSTLQTALELMQSAFCAWRGNCGKGVRVANSHTYSIKEGELSSGELFMKAYLEAYPFADPQVP